MTDFGELLRSGSAPCVDGFFRADGTVRQVCYDGPKLSWFELGPPFTPDWEYDTEDLVDIDWADRAFLTGGQNSVFCGEGPRARTASSPASIRMTFPLGWSS